MYAEPQSSYDCERLPDNFRVDEYPMWKEVKGEVVHVIHNSVRKDRFLTLQKEIKEQGLTVIYWPAIMDEVMSFRGIARAHKSIVKWAKEQGLKKILIAEDDVKFLSPNAFDYFVGKEPQDYDLFLGNIFEGQINEEKIVGDFCGLTLYMIHERFYDTFLAANEMNNFDRSLARLGKYVVCNPMVCSQYGGWSDNKKCYIPDYDHHLKQYKTL